MEGGVGESLRAAREARGLNLEDVEERLKIRRRFLDAIEREQWDMLPEPAYARAFLRSYAALLGLDGDELVERYRDQQHEEAADSIEMEIRNGDRLVVAPPATDARPIGSRPHWGLIAGAAAVIAVAALVLFLALRGGDSGPTATDGNASSEAATTGTEPEPTPPSEPSKGRVELTATGAVWACVVDGDGNVLLDGVTLTAGEKQGPFKAKRLEMNLGNGLIELTANGEQLPIDSAANPVGYVVTASGVRDLPEGKRPSCG